MREIRGRIANRGGAVLFLVGALAPSAPRVDLSGKEGTITLIGLSLPVTMFVDCHLQ
jgi:hypothetical protein